MTRVLAVDDEKDLLRVLVLGLEAEGVDVVPASRFRDAMDLLTQRHDLDAAILDIDLSRGDSSSTRGDEGLVLLRRIRAISDIPVIMLSSTDVEDIKVHALNLGADDYMTKPFGPREIVARLGAILRRRNAGPKSRIVEAGALRIEVERQLVFLDDRPVGLTHKEFSILWSLARARGRVLTRRQILDAVWGDGHFGDERVVDVHVRHLRKKIEATPGRPEFVITVRGSGYRFGTPQESAEPRSQRS